ncbi:MAG: ABC-2 family transporter protein [bacterium]
MNNWYKKLKKYQEIIRISNNEMFASPGNFIGRIVIFCLRISLFGIIYPYVFKSSNLTSINGISVIQIVWSLALVQIIYQFSRKTYQDIRDEIMSGQIETKLNKPYSFLNFVFVDAMGKMPIQAIIYAVTIVLLLGTVFGIPHFTFVQIIGLIILFILGVILFTLNMILLAICAFWMENPDPVYWIIGKLSWFVNGTFIPLAILPASFRTIATYFPFSAPFFLGRIFEISTLTGISQLIIIQLIWIVVFAFIIKYLYRLGIKKVSINGG